MDQAVIQLQRLAGHGQRLLQDLLLICVKLCRGQESVGQSKRRLGDFLVSNHQQYQLTIDDRAINANFLAADELLNNSWIGLSFSLALLEVPG